MKTLEDEAFDEIAKRQGGGFQTKRKMAADKVQDETDMLTIAYQSGYYDGKKAAQRPWVGLTNDEVKEIHNASRGKDVGIATGLTERKLKDKNT